MNKTCSCGIKHDATAPKKTGAIIIGVNDNGIWINCPCGSTMLISGLFKPTGERKEEDE